MKKRIFALFMVAAMLFSQSVFADGKAEYEKIEQILNYAANLYIDDSVTSSELMSDAVKNLLEKNPELATELIKAGFEGLDQYSEFYTAEEYATFINNINHVVYGIGVLIQKVEDYITVMDVLDDGSAYEAGVMAGDKIIAVDGANAVGESIDKVQDMVLGELGTEVVVTFLRDDKEITYTMKRGEVKGETVKYGTYEGNIGYMTISTIAANTDKEVMEAVDFFDKEGVKDIIIDLRNNPGGYFDAAINIASLFVPEGVIASTVYRSEWENETFYSKQTTKKYNIAVVVNENTASAAEVLASAIQDSKAGIVIGKKTYGKGVIQQMYEIWDGCAFKITTGRYFTRNGKDINGNGITPDKEVDNELRPIDLTRYTAFDYVNKPYVGATSQNTKAAKEKLRILGYYAGVADENYDEKLAKAVSEFQEENELFPYGVLDISTQKKIEEKFGELEEIVDHQIIEAYLHLGGKMENVK